jgi:hypothetical protein
MKMNIVDYSPCHKTKVAYDIDLTKADADGIVTVEGVVVKCSFCRKPWTMPALAIRVEQPEVPALPLTPVAQ